MSDSIRFLVSDLYHAGCGDTLVVNADQHDTLLFREKMLLDQLNSDAAKAETTIELLNTAIDQLAGRFISARDLLLNTKGWLPKHSDVYAAIDAMHPLQGGWEAWPDGGPGLEYFERLDIRLRSGVEILDCRVSKGAATLKRFYWPKTPDVIEDDDIVAIRRLPKKHDVINVSASFGPGDTQ